VHLARPNKWYKRRKTYCGIPILPNKPYEHMYLLWNLKITEDTGKCTCPKCLEKYEEENYENDGLNF